MLSLFGLNESLHAFEDTTGPTDVMFCNLEADRVHPSYMLQSHAFVLCNSIQIAHGATTHTADANNN